MTTTSTTGSQTANTSKNPEDYIAVMRRINDLTIRAYQQLGGAISKSNQYVATSFEANFLAGEILTQAYGLTTVFAEERQRIKQERDDALNKIQAILDVSEAFLDPVRSGNGS